MHEIKGYGGNRNLKEFSQSDPFREMWKDIIKRSNEIYYKSYSNKEVKQ